MNAQGEFVITWEGRTADGGFNVYANASLRRELALETRLSPRELLRPISCNPTVAVDQDGSIVILWGQNGAADGDSWGVYGRRFNQCGVPQGEEFRVIRRRPATNFRITSTGSVHDRMATSWRFGAATEPVTTMASSANALPW